MAAVQATRTVKRRIVIWILLLSLFWITSIAGAYATAIFEAKHESDIAVAKALHAQQTAEEGRSRALCSALKELAITPAAVKLHPIFQNVYMHTGCEPITGIPES